MSVGETLTWTMHMGGWHMKRGHNLKKKFPQKKFPQLLGKKGVQEPPQNPFCAHNEPEEEGGHQQDTRHQQGNGLCEVVPHFKHSKAWPRR